MYGPNGNGYVEFNRGERFVVKATNDVVKESSHKFDFTVVQQAYQKIRGVLWLSNQCYLVRVGNLVQVDNPSRGEPKMFATLEYLECPGNLNAFVQTAI